MHIRLALISLMSLSLVALATPHGGAVAPEHGGSSSHPEETLPPPTAYTFPQPEELHRPMQKLVDSCPIYLPDCADKTKEDG